MVLVIQDGMVREGQVFSIILMVIGILHGGMLKPILNGGGKVHKVEQDSKLIQDQIKHNGTNV